MLFDNAIMQTVTTHGLTVALFAAPRSWLRDGHVVCLWCDGELVSFPVTEKETAIKAYNAAITTAYNYTPPA